MADNFIKLSAKETLRKKKACKPHFLTERNSQLAAKEECKGLRKEQVKKKSLILHTLWADPLTCFCDVFD